MSDVFPALLPMSLMRVAVTMLLRVERANQASSSVTFAKDCVTMRLDTAAGARWTCTLQPRSNCNAAAGTLPLILTLAHAIVPEKCKVDFSEFNVVRAASQPQIRTAYVYASWIPSVCRARASLRAVTAASGAGDAQGGARAAVV
jgi:hypothetical protein